MLEVVPVELMALADWLGSIPELDLARAEVEVLTRLREVGSQVLQAGIAAQQCGDFPLVSLPSSRAHLSRLICGPAVGAEPPPARAAGEIIAIDGVDGATLAGRFERWH